MNTSIAAILPFCYMLLGSCNPESRQSWKSVHFNADISKDSVFQRLDKQTECSCGAPPFTPSDTFKRSTSAVSYTYRVPGVQKPYRDMQNKCVALLDSDGVLHIRFVVWEDGYNARGLSVLCSANKFQIQPYDQTDVILIGEPESTYQPIFDYLSLDNEKYEVDDNLYGYVEYRSLETLPDGLKREHAGKGFFRAKVKAQ